MERVNKTTGPGWRGGLEAGLWKACTGSVALEHTGPSPMLPMGHEVIAHTHTRSRSFTAFFITASLPGLLELSSMVQFS